MIVLKSDNEIDAMRKSGHLSWQLLEEIAPQIKPGISTQEIDDFVVGFVKKHNVIAAPLNYKGFPKSVCTSVNEVICHGIPNKKHLLKDGDIINVDVTLIVDGFHGDTSRTFLVGNVSDQARKLVDCARDAMNLGIAAVADGCRVGDIGHAIQSHAERLGYGVVRDFVGHGIGRTFHEDPKIAHYGARGKGLRLTKGMVFTVEPMINERDWRCRILKDEWTAVTVDGGWSAQFEHTVAIRNDGRVEILTQP